MVHHEIEAHYVGQRSYRDSHKSARLTKGKAARYALPPSRRTLTLYNTPAFTCARVSLWLPMQPQGGGLCKWVPLHHFAIVARGRFLLESERHMAGEEGGWNEDAMAGACHGDGGGGGCCSDALLVFKTPFDQMIPTYVVRQTTNLQVSSFSALTSILFKLHLMEDALDRKRYGYILILGRLT